MDAKFLFLGYFDELEDHPLLPLSVAVEAKEI